MKVQIISDLHQEFGFSDLDFSTADVIIFAGDINIQTKGIEWMLDNFSNQEVLYILGNHEYYKGSYPRTLHKIKNLAQGTNIHVLENESIEINEVTFHGTTLWTDFQLLGNPRTFGMICQEKMNDYKKIRRDPSYSKMRSIDTFHIHQKSVQWLKDSLKNSKSEKDIVITHHAPSLQSVPEKHIDDPISSAYASNLDQFIKEYQPDYWIHGHMHTPVSYEIEKTKVICNPHGYTDEKYNGFDRQLIIDI